MFPRGAHKINKLIRGQQGLTLIELLLALSILSIVIVASYSFYFYVNRSFTTASNQAEVQFNVRAASERIENLVRFASSAKIEQNYTGVLTGEAIYEDSNSIMYFKGGAATNLLGNSYGDISFNIDFNKTADGLLYYSIKGTGNDGKPYQITKEIQLLGIKIDDGKEFFKDFVGPGKVLILEP